MYFLDYGAVVLKDGEDLLEKLAIRARKRAERKRATKCVVVDRGRHPDGTEWTKTKLVPAGKARGRA